MKSVQLMVSKVLIIHENMELFPSGDSYGISPDNIDTTERVTLVIVVIPIRNKLGWVGLVRYYLA